MKHIKFFETKEEALLKEIENPSVLKIEDKLYYSEGQEGIITEISDDQLTIVSRLDYFKNQPLTITNIGDTEGVVSIIGRNPSFYRHKSFQSGYLRFYNENKGIIAESDINWTNYHNSHNYTVCKTTLQPGKSVKVKASTTLKICNYSRFSNGNQIPPYLNFELSGSTFKASGNLMSIETPIFPDSSNYTQKNGLFWRLFDNCTNLIDIKDLYCPIVGQYCYRETFWNSGVKNLPSFEFFSKQLSQSAYDYCCQWMFKDCNNLKDLSDYVLFDQEYVIGESDCYGMFTYCDNLEKAPVINYTRSNNSSFTDMFKYCYNLSEIKYLGDVGENNMHYDWVNNVANSGVMYVKDSVCEQWQQQGCSTSTCPCGWELKTI